MKIHFTNTYSEDNGDFIEATKCLLELMEEASTEKSVDASFILILSLIYDIIDDDDTIFGG